MNNNLDYKNINVLTDVDSKLLSVSQDLNNLTKSLKETMIVDDDYITKEEITDVINDVSNLENDIKEFIISCTRG